MGNTQSNGFLVLELDRPLPEVFIRTCNKYESPTIFNKLPFEVLSNVLSFLESDEIVRAGSVCKLWYHCSSCETTWKRHKDQLDDVKYKTSKQAFLASCIPPPVTNWALLAKKHKKFSYSFADLRRKGVIADTDYSENLRSKITIRITLGSKNCISKWRLIAYKETLATIEMNLRDIVRYYKQSKSVYWFGEIGMEIEVLIHFLDQILYDTK